MLRRTHIKSSRQYMQRSFLPMISVLLIGFLSGNLFGTLLIFVRKFVIWDGFIIGLSIIIIEGTSYISYKPRHSRFSYRFGIKALSFFKIGLMIGFFVDAFKVGS